MLGKKLRTEDDKWSTNAARKAAAKNYSATKKLSNNFKD